MATGETAPPVALSSSSPPMLENSPSNLSSPLSDMEDKDADPDEMDLDLPNSDPGARLGTPDQVEDDDEDEEEQEQEQEQEQDQEQEENPASRARSASTSAFSLSDDSEAETERLYDTPPKKSVGRAIVVRAAEGRAQLFAEPRSSKLQHQVGLDLAQDGSDNDELSDEEEKNTDGRDDAPEKPVPTFVKRRNPIGTADEMDNEDLSDEDEDTPLFPSKPSQPTPQESIPTPDAAKQEPSEKRKRKRSSAAEQLESEQPLRKRTGSVGVPEGEFSADDTAVVDDETGTPTIQTREQSPDEEDPAEEGEADKPKSKDVPTQSIEDTPQPARSLSVKRGTAKKRKGRGDGGGGTESAQEDGETATAEEDGARNAEEEQGDADADEEAELAHKEEEQRKKAAWEELSAIEKQFSNFRERLYQERLDQLNQEEAMLVADNPTHPEYLAMLKCIDERRDERIRLSLVELKLRMDLLKRKAVSERSQIMTQFHQGVRASREKVLEDLGREWYEIQHERRRFANNIPDFGIRFPPTKTQTVRQAVAYNKEVSILSGVARFQGFPAAPDIRGATDDQIENDFEAITRTRRAVLQQHDRALIPPAPAPSQNVRNELPAPAPAPLPFTRNKVDVLGPAGEQFLEQTPWANPNHPVHQIQRQQPPPQQHEMVVASATAPLYAGLPPASGRRHSHQPPGGGFYAPARSNSNSSGNPFLNGGEPMHKSHSAQAGHEKMKPTKMGVVDVGVKREALSNAA